MTPEAAKKVSYKGRESADQPHRPLARIFFGINISELQDKYGAKLAGFATSGHQLTVNSGGFNTHAYKGSKDNGFRDDNKSMSEAEASLLIGAWVCAVKNGWPTDKKESFTVT